MLPWQRLIGEKLQESYNDEAKQELRHIIALVTNVQADYVFVVDVRANDPTALQIQFQIVVPTSKAAGIASSLTQDNLEVTMASSSLSLFNGIDQVQVLKSANVIAFDEYHLFGVIGTSVGYTLSLVCMIWCMIWCCRRYCGSYCCRKCNKACDSASESRLDLEAGVPSAGQTAGATDKFVEAGAKDQGLCYAATGEPLASVVVEPVGHVSNAQEAWPVTEK